MQYENKTLYKDTEGLTWCYEGKENNLHKLSYVVETNDCYLFGFEAQYVTDEQFTKFTKLEA